MNVCTSLLLVTQQKPGSRRSECEEDQILVSWDEQIYPEVFLTAHDVTFQTDTKKTHVKTFSSVLTHLNG